MRRVVHVIRGRQQRLVVVLGRRTATTTTTMKHLRQSCGSCLHWHSCVWKKMRQPMEAFPFCFILHITGVLATTITATMTMMTTLFVPPSPALPIRIGNWVSNNTDNDYRKRILRAATTPRYYFNPSHDCSPRFNPPESSTFPLTMMKQQQQIMTFLSSPLLMKIPVRRFKSMWGIYCSSSKM